MATVPKTPQPLRSSLAANRVSQIANSPDFVQAQRWFVRERAWINDIHLQLCRIPSATFFERQRAEWLRLQLENLGWTAQIDRAGNVLAVFGAWAAAPRSLVMSAHLDTVFAPGRPEDVYFAPDGRIVGPGTSDNGAGLSALLALCRCLSDHPEWHGLASSVLVAANVGEEGEGNLSGMRYLCQQFQSQTPRALSGARAFIVLDGPSTEHITAQALASWRYEVTFNGTGGHTWNDQGTPNPVHALGDAIASFVRSADAIAGSGNRPQCSYNFSVVEGGTSINSIPASARAKLDIRSEDPGMLNELAALVGATVERSLEQGNRTAKSKRLTARIKDLGSRPGGKLPVDSRLLQAIQQVDGQLNIKSRLQCASTDANVPLSLGLQAISIGAGGHGGGSHTRDEWYQPDGREAGLRRILLLLAVLHEAFSVSEEAPAE